MEYYVVSQTDGTNVIKESWNEVKALIENHGDPFIRFIRQFSTHGAARYFINFFNQHDEFPPERDLLLRHGRQKLTMEEILAKIDAELDEEQKLFFNLVLVHQKNAFLTGPGGTGKSFVVKKMIELLKESYGDAFDQRVGIAASTGIAAAPIGGTTLHSLMGIPVFTEYSGLEVMWGVNERRGRVLSDNLEVLVIEEVSMLSGELLDALNTMLKSIRHNPKPFGGLQVIMVGDFYQLPNIVKPVDIGKHDLIPTNAADHPNRNMPIYLSESGRGERKEQKLFTGRGIAFQSELWFELDLHVIKLTKVHRQSNQEYIQTLHILRRFDDGINHPMIKHHIARLNSQFYNPKNPANAHLQPLHLYSVNEEANTHNRRALDALPGVEVHFECIDFVWYSKMDLWVLPREDRHAVADRSVADDIEDLQKQPFYANVLAPKKFDLKEGAQVLLLSNLDLRSEKKLCNGSQGVCVGYADDEEVRSLTEDNVRRIHERFQINAPRQPPQDQEAALSGLSDWSGPPNENDPPKDTFETLLVIYTKVLHHWLKKNNNRLPKVQFRNGRIQTIFPQLFYEKIGGLGAAVRIQLPLRLGFAITIHKSQGMTLNEVVIDFNKIFAEGQAYVALSRIGPDCSLLRFRSELDISKVKCSRLVKLWMDLQDKLGRLKSRLYDLMPHETQEEKKVIEEIKMMGQKSLYERSTAEMQEDIPGRNDAVMKQWRGINDVLQNLKPSWNALPPRPVTVFDIPRLSTIPIWQAMQYRIIRSSTTTPTNSVNRRRVDSPVLTPTQPTRLFTVPGTL